MKITERANLLLLLILIIFNSNSFAQSCVPTSLNNRVYQLSCNNPCLNLTYKVPHLKSTTDYVVGSIPYAAFPYDQGTAIPSTYIDDQFSPLIPSPFPICFYGQTYTDIIVGSNGVVTFEAICANQDNAYPLDLSGTPVPIPNNNGAGPTGIGTLYYPRASIFGPYHDINPNTSPLPTRRIEYNVFGTAPCRKLVVSFLDVKLFSCTSLVATSQIVIYENTGIVEVFIKDKPVCPAWNDGLAIIGIQDETRTKAVAPPGKNATVFTENNTGYRFTPSGNTSRYVSAELLDMAGTVIAVADTTTTTAGLLDITFPNTCPSANLTQYQVRTTFSSCPIGADLVSLDTITVVRNNVLPVTATSTNAACGVNNGSITVTVAPGSGTPPYQYGLNGGTLQPGNVFTGLAGGTYSVYATDVFGCDTTFNVVVNVTSNLTATVTSANASCPGVTNGSITVTPTAGTAPYTYSLNGGTPQASGTFSGLASANYTIVFTDNLGCTGTITRFVGPGVSIGANFTKTNTSCTGANNGAIQVNATGGTGPYTFVLNGGSPVTGNPGYNFTGLTAGNYTITISDAGGCTYTSPVQVLSPGPGLTANGNVTPASCPGATNGSLQIQPLTGSSPFSFTINPGGITNSTGTFTGLTGGVTYTVTWTTGTSGCIGTVVRTISSGTANVTGTAATTATSCAGAADGTITITPTSGGAPYDYSLDGTTWQTSPTFTGLAAAAYTIRIRSAGTCTGNINATVAAGASTIASTNVTVPTSCNGASDGSVTVTPTSGTGPYQYNIDGGTFQPSNIFTGLASGAHTIVIRDITTTCTGTFNINVAAGASLAFTNTITATSCPGINNGAITVTPTNGSAPYSFKLDRGTAQPTGTFSNLTAGAHTVIFTDANSCSGTVNFTVTQGAALTVTATTVATSCPGISNGSATAVPGVAGTYTYAIDGGAPQATPNFTGLAGGAHSIVISAPSGCTGTVNFNVGTGTAITGTFTATPTTCNIALNGSATATPTNGTAPYTYALDGGTFGNSATFNNISSGAHSITIRDNNGCQGVVNVTVPIGAGISATAATTATACPGINNGTITISASAGTAPYTYALDGGTAQPSNIFNNVSSGAHSILVRDANGCTFTVTPTVASGAAITGTFTATATTCNIALNGSATATPTNGSAPYTYALDAGTFGNSPTFNNISSGAHTITIRDNNGCQGVVNVTVPVGTGISATAATTATACPGINNGTITISASAGTAPYTYALDGGTAQAASIFNNVSSGAHSILVRDANGCTFTVSPTVASGAAITGTFTATATTCNIAVNGSATATPTNGSAPYTYALDAGTFGNSPTFNNISSGAHAITIKDNNGCTGVVNVTVPVGTGITATAATTSTACPGVNNGTITLTPAAGTAPYTYALDGGTAQAANIFNNVSSGAHSILVRDANGCTFTVASNVAQGAAITGTANATATTCSVASNGSATATPTNGAAPYTYSLDGGTFVSNATFTNISSGAHIITIKDKNGCTGDVNVSVPVGNGISATASSTGTACPGVNNGTISVTAAAGSTPYTYKLDAGTAQASNNFTGVTSGNHSVLVTDANGCTYTVAVTVTQGAALTGTTSIKPTCLGLSSGTLTVTTNSGLAPYSFSKDSGTTFQTSKVFNNLPDGNYSILIKDAAGCTGTTTGTVTVAPPVQAFAGNDTIAVAGVPHQLTGSGGVGYVWSPSGNLNNPFTATPLATITGDTRFYLQVTDFAGCIGRDTILLKVYNGPTYYVPNAFSPNGDGLNDIFRPIPVGISNTQFFRIFNRYGELVFQTNQWLKGWDGTYKGKQQPIGAYIWMIRGIDRNGKIVEMKGTVMMVQ